VVKKLAGLDDHDKRKPADAAFDRLIPEAGND
jgi:hypothetical protein